MSIPSFARLSSSVGGLFLSDVRERSQGLGAMEIGPVWSVGLNPIASYRGSPTKAVNFRLLLHRAEVMAAAVRSIGRLG